LAGGFLRLIYIKPILSYTFLLKVFFQNFISIRVDIPPKYYIVASYVALGANQKNWNNQVPPPPCRMHGPELLT
jgi:hypothetical protein